jgi:hypothetical protein
MSPGSVTERLHFFIAEYDTSMRIGPGGGVAQEGEDIELLELPLETALDMTTNGGIIDAKTVMLLQYLALNVMPAQTRRNMSESAPSDQPTD